MRARGTQFIFRNGNAFVRKRGPANRTKVIELHDKPFAHAVEIRDVIERAPLAPLSELAVAGVQQGDVRCTMAFAGNRRAHAGVHPPAQKHNCFSLIRSYHHYIHSRCSLYP